MEADTLVISEFTSRLDPVTAPVTLRFDKAASEPLTMTFFQFGIMFCSTAVGYLKS